MSNIEGNRRAGATAGATPPVNHDLPMFPLRTANRAFVPVLWRTPDLIDATSTLGAVDPIGIDPLA